MLKELRTACDVFTVAMKIPSVMERLDYGGCMPGNALIAHWPKDTYNKRRMTCVLYVSRKSVFPRAIAFMQS